MAEFCILQNYSRGKVPIVKYLLLFTLTLTACTSSVVIPYEGKNTYTKGSCTVEVYNSMEYAQEFGTVAKVCTVSGSSARSFDHSVNGAIKKNIKKICGCGASKAYIVSTSQENDLGMKGVTNITLVGFRYR